MSADVDYETEYNNRARVPENPAIIAGWSRDAQAYREAHQAHHKVISYGAGERNRIDLFSGDGAGPIVVFIHGGYWQALDGSFFSHLAGGLNAHDIDVAVPSYDLWPFGFHRRVSHESCGVSGALKTRTAARQRAVIPPAVISPPACWRRIGARSMHRCRKGS